MYWKYHESVGWALLPVTLVPILTNSISSTQYITHISKYPCNYEHYSPTENLRSPPRNLLNAIKGFSVVVAKVSSSPKKSQKATSESEVQGDEGEVESDLSDSDQTFLPVASSTELDGRITSTTASEGMFPPASSESLSHEEEHKLRHKQNDRDQKAVSTHVTSVPDTPPLEGLPPSTSAAPSIFPSRVLRSRHTVQPEPSNPTSPVLSISSENEKHSPRKKRRRILQRVVADSSDSEVPAPITRSRIRLEEIRKDREAPRRLKSSVWAEQDPSITEPRSKTAKVLRLSIVKASCSKSMDESSLSSSSEEDFEPISMRLRIKHRTQVDKNNSHQEDDVDGVVSSKQSQSSDSYVEECPGQTQSHKKKEREGSLESSEDEGEWTTSLSKVQSKNSNQKDKRASTVKTFEPHEEDRHADAPSRMNKSGLCQKGGGTKANGAVSNTQFEPISMRLRIKHRTQVDRKNSHQEDDVDGVVSSKQSQSSDSYVEERPGQTQSHKKKERESSLESSEDEGEWTTSLSKVQSKNSNQKDKRASTVKTFEPHEEDRHTDAPSRMNKSGLCQKEGGTKANGAVSNTQFEYSHSMFVEKYTRKTKRTAESKNSNQKVKTALTMKTPQADEEAKCLNCSRCGKFLKHSWSKRYWECGQKTHAKKSEVFSWPKCHHSIFNKAATSCTHCSYKLVPDSPRDGSNTVLSAVEEHQVGSSATATSDKIASNATQCPRQKEDLPSSRQGAQSDNELTSNATQSPEEKEDLSSTRDSPKKRQPSTITVTQSSRKKEDLPNHSQREQSVDELASNVTVTQSIRQMKDLPLTRMQIKRQGVKSDNEFTSNTTPIPGQKEDLPSTGGRPKTRKGIQFDNQLASNIIVTQSTRQRKDLPSKMERPNKRKRVLSDDDVASNVTVTRNPGQIEDLPSTKNKPKRRRGVPSDDEVASNITVTQNSTQKDVPPTEKQRQGVQPDDLASVTATQSPRQEVVLSTKGRPKKKKKVQFDDVLASNIIDIHSTRQNKAVLPRRGRPSKKQRVESDNDLASNIIVTRSTMKKGVLSTRGRPKKSQWVHFDDDLPSNVTVTQNTRQKGDVRSARGRPKKRKRVRFHNASDSGDPKQEKRQRNAPDREFDRSRVPQILSSSCFLSPQPTQSVVHLPVPAEDELESEVDGIETVNLENDCVTLSLEPEFSVEEPIQTSIEVAGKSTKQTRRTTSELFSETEAPSESDDFLKELRKASEPLSPFDELLLSTANLGRSAGEGLQVTNSATPGKVSSLDNNQLLWTDYEEEVLKGAGNDLSSGEAAPQGNSDEYSGFTDSADEDCLSEYTTASTWVHSSEPTRHNRTGTQSTILTIPGQYHQAITRTKENIKLSSRTTLFNVRKAPQKSAMSHSPNKALEMPPLSESVVEETISAQGSVKVGQTLKHTRKRKLESTESSSGNETDSLAPIQVGARLCSPNFPTKYLLLTPATGEEERLEQASPHERPTTRKKITARGQHTTAAARKGSVHNSNEKAALAKENREPLHLDVTLEDEDSEDQKSFFQDTTDSGSEDNTIHPLASEHSQPETVNLIDDEVENTQACTQYDYAPLEKIAYASESETVVSDSTASCSPVYTKKPYLPRLYAFHKQH